MRLHVTTVFVCDREASRCFRQLWLRCNRAICVTADSDHQVKNKQRDKIVNRKGLSVLESNYRNDIRHEITGKTLQGEAS
jgi:hypothetical protein